MGSPSQTASDDNVQMLEESGSDVELNEVRAAKFITITILI